MMQALRDKARALLESGAVSVVIGYADGSESGKRSRAFFARKPDQTKALVYNGHCRQNLATYLLKPEVRAFGKAAVVSRDTTLRTLLEYAVENQLTDATVVALAVSDQGEVTELNTLAAIEEYVAKLTHGLPAEAEAELTRFEQMPLEERRDFWASEFSRCIKCYACRAACPLCYCSRCVVEANQPQWVPLAADPLGNLEWNVVRAMHLAGRCIDCKSCAEACPSGIRLDLIHRTLAGEARTQFGAEAGYSLRKNYALAAFKPDDKEEFIR
jgi:formate dehydrogenase subunit beta